MKFLILKGIKQNLINNFFLNGKKTKLENFFLKSIKFLQKTYYKNHVMFIKQSVLQTKPILSIIKIKRSNNASKEIPFVVAPNKRVFLSIQKQKNLIKVSSKEGFKKIYPKLIIKLCKIKNLDESLYKQVHKQAFSVKKYANFRWF
uniref:Ribosomal protein S7 n=1 Tax=Trieres regia TaxID=1335017 RepID=A0A7T4WR27_9STRA|nr:ribosomal protein S7 [Odontella regia]QQD79312.1 ribosomal protein S7 [Odontella regia]